MKRHNGKIPTKKLKNHETFNYFFFFDTETQQTIIDNQEHHFLKVGYVKELNKGGSFFTDVKYFWQFIQQYRNKGTVVVFAHNMHFDFNIVEGLRQLSKYGYEIDFPVFESGTFILRARNPKTEQRLLFLDTFNYFKTSVERMGEMLGLPKGIIDFETCTMEELKEYCKRDVEIIELIISRWLDFIDKHQFGGLQYTIASQSFTAYRVEDENKIPVFMKDEIYTHTNPVAIQLEQESYRGGRTEAFHIGTIKDVSTIDVNSLYPFVMQNNYFPTKLLGVRENLNTADLHYLMHQGYLVIAECEVETYQTAFGFRHKNGHTHKLIFPIGKFTVTLCNPEILFLLSSGGKIHKVHKVAFYESAKIFDTFVTELYKLRLEYQEQGDYTFQNMVKYLLNSLYGKFGQKQRFLKEIGEAPEDIVLYEHCVDMETGKRFTQFVFGGKVWVQTVTDELSTYSCPAIASFVTAYARIYLHLLMQIPNTVYYCDTDSLMIPTEEIEKFGYLLGKNLGQLKVEYTGKDCYIFGAKDYVIDKIVKRKGIKKNAVEVSKNVFEQQQFYKTKSLIKMGLVDRVVVDLVQKKCERKYTKGIVLANGKVEPIVLTTE